jgi:hypothetical protein
MYFCLFCVFCLLVCLLLCRLLETFLSLAASKNDPFTSSILDTMVSDMQRFSSGICQSPADDFQGAILNFTLGPQV